MTALPALPALAAFKNVPHVAASAAERLLACPLRFAFDQDPALRRLQPYAASAIVGTAAHAALAALITAHGSGRISGRDDATRAVARSLFDEALAAECRRRDAAIAERGALPGDSNEQPAALPFYSMTRARLARFAEQRFGGRWLWPAPQLAARGRRPAESVPRPLHEIEAEFLIRSKDGVLLGVADAIDRRASGTVIEEFKSGEPTPERLESWKRQLLIYAHLFREQFGAAPALLRVHSLPGGTFEFACAEGDAERAARETRAALGDFNSRIDAGAAAHDLARPSADSCAKCPHRPWCESYWSASAPGSDGADIEGTVAADDGWEAELLLSDGSTKRVDLRAVRIAPALGTRLRICGARVTADGALRCTRSTSVWRVRP